jgi:hypothetical protein
MSQKQTSLKQRAVAALAEIVQLVANDIEANPETLNRAVQHIIDAAVTEALNRVAVHVLVRGVAPDFPVEVWAHTQRQKVYIGSYRDVNSALADFPATIDLTAVAHA